VTSGGRLFQRRLPATGNARSPTVDSRVRQITSCEDDDDRRSDRRSVDIDLHHGINMKRVWEEVYDKEQFCQK